MTTWEPAKGDRVAVYCHGSYANTVRFDTVERLTVTQIVLADGSRWKRGSLREVGSARGGALFYELKMPDDPLVLDVRARAVLRTLAKYVEEHARPAGSWSVVEITNVIDDIAKAAELTRRKVGEIYARRSDS